MASTGSTPAKRKDTAPQQGPLESSISSSATCGDQEVGKLESYAVGDCVPPGDGLCVVFLLESPFESEVLHKHPLAGASGKIVTAWLVDKLGEEFAGWEDDIPFGCHLQRETYEKIGLMNCSKLPMDKSVYRCSYASDEKIIGMNLIRENPKSKTRDNPEHAEIEKEIIDDLKTRLQALRPHVVIVPCGDLARTMAKKIQADLPKLKIYPKKVPHPSHGHWAKNPGKVMDDLAKALRLALSSTQWASEGLKVGTGSRGGASEGR